MTDLDSLVLVNLGRTAITLGGLVTALVILATGFVLSRLAQSGLRRLRGRYERNSGSIYIVEKVAGYGLVIIGAVVALSSLGLDLTSLAVFAGAIGIGVGLGMQGVVKEFVSGLILIFDRMLAIGDYIELEDGARGMVQEIGPRATRVRNNDNIDVLVPNSLLIENPVTVAISVSTSCCGLSLAMLVVARSNAAPPQPTSCSRQKPRFLSAKNGVGANGSIVIVSGRAGLTSRVAGLLAAGRLKGSSQLRTGAPPRSRRRSLRGRPHH